LDAVINGKITYIEGIMLDITKKNDGRCHKRLEYAEAAIKAKSEFLANIAMKSELL
jgi:hypothetical protein